VIGVVDDPADAARCVQALEAMGIAPHDILHVPGSDAVDQLEK
jgi:hypothetical protein